MTTNYADTKTAAANLYKASRELAMPAAQHELMGTSHDRLQTFIADQEAAMTHKDNEIATLKNVVRELEKMKGQAVPADVAKLALDLCYQIEKCGASEELTKATVMASELHKRLTAKPEAKP